MPDAPAIKSCKSCKYLIGVRINESSWELWKCGHPKAFIETNVVLGTKIYQLCTTMRKNNVTINTCMHDGNWWEEYVQMELTHIEPTISAPIFKKAGKYSLDL